MTNADLDFGRFEALTFDCFGTLIDWESGILAGLRPALAAGGVVRPDDELLEAYARAESAAEAGPYLSYRAVLERCFLEVCGRYGVEPDDAITTAFGASVGEWPAFPDSSGALRLLATRFPLGVITNCDDDLFAASNPRLGITFDWVITAQAVGAYKPDERAFKRAFATLGLPRSRILHVAQSLFHDHVPAKRLGLATVWIDRRHGRTGSGATPVAAASPDATFPDMATFAAAATAG
jgi:2-haloacid dehalogenase